MRRRDVTYEEARKTGRKVAFITRFISRMVAFGLAAAASSVAHAGWMQVAVWDKTDNIYVVNIHQPTSGLNGLPYASYKLGASGELQLGRSYFWGAWQACARFKMTSTDAWTTTCHVMSGTTFSRAFSGDDNVVALMSGTSGNTPPDFWNSGVGYQSKSGGQGCPEGTTEECRTRFVLGGYLDCYPEDDEIDYCDWSSIWTNVVRELCTCTPEEYPEFPTCDEPPEDDDEEPGECDPLQFEWLE